MKELTGTISAVILACVVVLVAGLVTFAVPLAVAYFIFKAAVHLF